MASIRQDVSADALPDFRNLGVTARILIGANAVVLAATLHAEPGFEQALEAFLRSAPFVEALLLASAFVLFAVSPALARLPYLTGCAVVMGIALLLAAAIHGFEVAYGAQAAWGRVLGFTGLLCFCLLAYFRLFARAYSPALAEARLQALQSRIRPHFLFNSLNAVLALIRSDPKRAEVALEDLAELFRMLMSDSRDFVRLANEIELAERYASLEQLRLGDRLRVTWELDAAPQDALLPPLILQPLIENAIYHGVEPGTGTGEVVVRIGLEGQRVAVHVANPLLDQPLERRGNRMALDNIRQRLLLFFDAEAQMHAGPSGRRFEVTLHMPYRVDATARGQGTREAA